MKIGERLKRIRQEKGFTQAELGKRLVPPVAWTNISSIERGETVPGAEKLQRLAKALGVTVAEIMGEKLPEPPPAEPLNKRSQKALEFFRAKDVPETDKETIERLIELHEERARKRREEGGKDSENDSEPDI